MSDLRAAREQIAGVTKALSGGHYQRIDKQVLMVVGQYLWPKSYQRHPEDDAGAFDYLVNTLRGSPDSMENLLGHNINLIPHEQIMQMGAARWYDQGLPVVQMGHKYAAALMASSVSPESVGEGVEAPWKAFLIEVPMGILSLVNPSTEAQESVTHVLVHRITRPAGDKVWNYMIFTEGAVTLWKHGASTRDLVDESLVDENDWASYSFGLETNDRDDRAALLVSRLIIGVCLAFSNQDTPVKKLGKGHHQEHQRRLSAEPLSRTFQIGAPLKLDCREAVRDYLEGRKSSKLSVQSLVRGHWKRQPYGPKAALRKWIWREPYWRGPEDAPILQRPHTMSKD